MALLPVGPPYYLYPEDSKKALGDIDVSRLNLNAPNTGAKYILLMMLTSLFYVIADVAADGMVVELAMREAEAVRGQVQTSIYLTRTVFSIFSVTLVGLCMNGKSYGGSFTWTLNFNDVMWILAASTLCVLPPTFYCLQENKHVREKCGVRCKEMWRIIQTRAVWQIMAWKFFSGVFSSFGAAPTNIVQREWAGVEPLNDAVFSIVGQMAFALTLYITKHHGLQWSWRKAIGYTTIMVVVIDSIVSYLTIYDVLRNQWFWLGVPVLADFPTAIDFIVSTFVVVEITEIGYEGVTYGLLTTISNLSNPVASSLYKTVDSFFDAFEDDVKRDDAYARNQVGWTFTIMYIMKLLSIFWLVLLPRQKAEAQQLRQFGGSSKAAGIIAIVCTLLAMAFAVSTNLLSIFPNTACLKIAGGPGC